jgi:hypothetical protein
MVAKNIIKESKILKFSCEIKTKCQKERVYTKISISRPKCELNVSFLVEE